MYEPLVIRSIAIAIFAAAIAMPVGLAQTTQDPKARCEQLIDYFDYYGQSRGEGVSDGARNMDRIGAGIDCERGDYQKGIAMMETLLSNKRMGIPAPGATSR